MLISEAQGKRTNTLKGYKEEAPLYGRYGSYNSNTLLQLQNIMHLIADNQVVEIYKNAYIASENLVYKGTFGAYRKSKEEKYLKMYNKPILQFIAAKGSLIIIFRKGAI